MNFRTLIKDAILEANAEFAATIETKLANLFGGDGPPTKKAAKGRPKGKANRKANRKRATPELMTKIREKTRKAITKEPMSKGEIMKKAKIPASEETRVRNVLATLVAEKAVKMTGERGSAKYEKL